MKRSSLYLATGAALVALAHLRWGIGALAWFAPLPLLHYLRTAVGWRSRALFITTLTVAWVIATSKIVTAPLPPMFALLGVAFGLLHSAAYLGADALRRRLDDRIGVLAFPATMAVVEWLQYRFTELASWSATGYTQVDNLPLLQVASLVGLVGVGFVVNLFAAALEHAWSRRRAAPLAIATALALVAHGFGAARLARTQPATTRVAAVNTIATFGPGSELDAAARAHIVDTLLADTASAAQSGARLVVWTEAAMLVTRDEEPAVIERLRAVAARLRIHLVAAYIVPAQPRFENKLVWLRPDGTVDHTYWKHHPAPGEPSVVGTGPLPLVSGDIGRLAGALCYDYDFPQLAAEHGALDVDLVALPSSDWRGIDPIHSQMAALRAIEQGISIVRSTRFGLTAAIDPHGRLRAWSSSFDTTARVTVADLPSRGTPTLYRHIGDAFAWLCAAALGAAIVSALLRRLAQSS